MRNIKYQGIGLRGDSLVVFFTSDTGVLKRFHEVIVPGSIMRHHEILVWFTDQHYRNTRPPWERDEPLPLDS